MALYLRSPGAALLPPREGRDAGSARLGPGEAFGAAVMVGLAAIYMAVFLGPWGELRSESLLATPEEALRHSLFVVGGAGLLGPLLWLGVGALARLAAGRPDVSLREVWSASAGALVPLGLGAWIAFTVAFVLASATYVPSALADPLGWGWNILGLRVPWQPVLPDGRLWLPLLAWVGGLAWAALVAAVVSRRRFGEGAPGARAGAVFAVALAAITGGLVWLGLG